MTFEDHAELSGAATARIIDAFGTDPVLRKVPQPNSFH
jgi:hypothetical protein